MKTYKGKINQLGSNQIFVFGSNPIGINGNPKNGKGGAALFALKKGWVSQGERMNNCFSKAGKAYGLVTVSGPGKNVLKHQMILERTFISYMKWPINIQRKNS
jgi:hypothetical protein